MRVIFKTLALTRFNPHWTLDPLLGHNGSTPEGKVERRDYPCRFVESTQGGNPLSSSRGLDARLVVRRKERAFDRSHLLHGIPTNDDREKQVKSQERCLILNVSTFRFRDRFPQSIKGYLCAL